MHAADTLTGAQADIDGAAGFRWRCGPPCDQTRGCIGRHAAACRAPHASASAREARSLALAEA
eukprot:645995-Prymnesium_polylepis.3